MMFRAASGDRIIHPAPCENPGLTPGESHSFHSVMRIQAMLTHPTPKPWTVGEGAQAVHPTARHSWTTCLDGEPALSVYTRAFHGLLISRCWVSLGREFWLFCCFGNQNMQVTSFSCVSQRTCLRWLNGVAVSINFLSFVGLCHNLHVVWVRGRDHWCLPEPFASIFSPLVLSIIYKSKEFKYGQIPKTSGTIQWIKVNISTPYEIKGVPDPL